MDISEIIRSIIGVQPAIPTAGQPAAPQQAAPQQAAPTAPQPAAVPQNLQSPPDLQSMYIELMKRNQNAQALDSGLNLIAAGFSNSPVNRNALIQGALGGHGGGGMSLSASDLINFEKLRQEQQNALIRKQAMPALMKQYNMTPAQIQALEAGGKLDEVLQHYSTENLGVADDAETGKKILFKPRTGEQITTLGGDKPDPTQVVSGPEGSQVINMRTGQPIAPGIGLPPNIDFKDTPAGVTALDKNTGKVIATEIGGAPTPDTQMFERPDGSKFLRDKRTSAITEVVAPTKPGDVIPPQEQELFAINKAREARGEKPMTAEELIKLKQTPATNINVGIDGSIHPKAPDGYDYVRDPATGKILIDEKGQVKYYKIPEGKPADEAAVKARELQEKDVKEARAKVQAVFAASNVGRAVKTALENVDKLGVAGVGSKFMRGLPSPGGLPSDKFDAAMSTISANVAFEALRQMRASSPAGGALGQVSDFENRMLRDTVAPLATYGDPKDLRAGLIRIQAAMEILANDDFGAKTDPANAPQKFLQALEARVLELGAAGPGVKVKKRE